MFTMRNYVFVGVAFGLITFLLMQLFGNEFATWARDMIADAQAAGSGSFGEFVGRPLEVMGENPLAAGVMVGVAWPLVFLWGGMTGILLLIILLA